jgi:hypothetical protein
MMKGLLQTIQQNLKVTIAAAMFAFCFLGTEQASAQTYQSPAQAMVTIDATIAVLSTPAKSAQPVMNVNAPSTGASSASVNTNAIAQALKVSYLMEVKVQLKLGNGTSASINNVYQALAGSANGRDNTLLSSTQQYVTNLLIQ